MTVRREGGIGEVRALVKRAVALGLESCDLDDEVHDTKGSEASNINNDGIESQLEYLRDNAGVKGVLTLLRLIADQKKEEE